LAEGGKDLEKKTNPKKRVTPRVIPKKELTETVLGDKVSLSLWVFVEES